MKRDYHHWYSPNLGRRMELLVFGHAGQQVLAFPTRDGRFYEYENLGVVRAIEDKIQAGQLQLVCVDHLAQESFYHPHCPPAVRIARHEAYEAYLLHEVIPFMRALNRDASMQFFGASLGAYYATNLAMRHPHLCQKLSAFSGRYDLTWSVDCFDNLLAGHYDLSVYYHTPSHFLPNLNCEMLLSQLRQMDITFAVGDQDPFLCNNQHLSSTLWHKAVPNSLHLWQGRAHQGGAWRRMAAIYL